MNNKVFFILIFISLSTLSCFAQEIKNISTEFDGEKIYINYDLISPETDMRFDVSVYASFNNFESPLKSVTGDVGKLVLPGKKKEVIWYLKDELPKDFNDQISFKIKATVSTAQFKLISSSIKKRYKRGSKINIKWTGGEITDLVNIRLLDKYGNEAIVKNNILNTGSHTIELDDDMKPGVYEIKFNSSFYRSLDLPFDPIRITRKVPLLLKAIPFALGVSTGVMIAGSDSGGSPDGSLPSAPDPE